MYPKYYETQKALPLQSYLFGHRVQPSQTKYEYLIEFLQVAIAKKENANTARQYDATDMFPVDNDQLNGNISYRPETRIGLKRFVFLPKSKLDGKAKVDQLAYNDCIRALEGQVSGDNRIKKQNSITIVQNLMNGFSAVNQSRSWFDQNMLPICPEVILPEGMGVKKWRQSLDYQLGDPDVDYKFDYHRYTYMCRGGEVYYLHLLNAINQFPQYKNPIQTRLREMITSFPQFSYLCNFVEQTWENRIAILDGDKPHVDKKLGVIPDSFSRRNEYTLRELSNFLNSKSHPFEKMETLANGIILQLLRAMYNAASTDSDSNCWVIDVNCSELKNIEAKKAAIAGFMKNEEIINNYLYSGLEVYRDVLAASDDSKIIKDAADDSYRLFRKMGKMIGIVIPNTGKGMRFTLSEDIVKFLVLAIIPPKKMITLDEFIELLYLHYGMVIGPKQYKIEMEKECVKPVGDFSFLEENKKAFAQKLKDCGFLRDLSDATSIVENPYEQEA